MRRLRLGKPSPALVVASVALVMAVGDTSYAAFKVGTKNIKNGAVTTKKIHKGAVTTSKIADGAVTGAQVNLSTLGTVPAATKANSLSSVSYIKGNVVTVSGKGGGTFGENSSGATCPAGMVVIGMGTKTGAGGVEVSESFVTPNGFTSVPPNSVVAVFDNFNTSAVPGNYVQAICTAASSVSNPAGFAKGSAAKR